MTTDSVAVGASRLWHRELTRYPGPSTRYTSLTIVVLATIVLYYQFYMSGAVATRILADYQMSFVYYVNISVVGFALGAIGSFATGLADRYGRANIVTVGLFIVGLLCLVAIPASSSQAAFGISYALIGLVEGVVLVATPALIRDFSPQIGRASAMGAWTFGPVLGSLVVAIQVSSAGNSFPWKHHYAITGIVGLVIAVIALFFLRELPASLRSQVMISSSDRALLEARAQGVDVEASLKHPFRQMLKPDIILSAFAISVFLIIYYLGVGFFPVYFQTIYGFTLEQANGLGDFMWAFNAGALILVGVLSDKLRVRKPFMLIGAIGAIVMTIIFLSRTSHPDTGFATFAVILSLLAIFLGTAYAPWMASFTETAEKRNPALAATGLAVWGLIIRIVIALSVLFLPLVVTTATTLVQHGPRVSEIAAGEDPALSAAQNKAVASIAEDPSIVPTVKRLSTRYADELETAQAITPATMATLKADPQDQQAISAAIGQISDEMGISTARAARRLKALTAVPDKDLDLLDTYGPPLQDPQVKDDLEYLQAHGAQVAEAAEDSPGQWRTYWWVAVGGEVVFIPLIWVLTGHWDPRKARREADEHEAWVAEKLAEHRGTTTS